MKKAILLKNIIIILLSFNCLIYAQENKNIEVVDKNSNLSKSSSFGFYFGVNLIASKINNIISPPVGISSNLGVEYQYSPFKYLSLEPSFDISIFHYGFTPFSKIGKDYSDGQIYICELENRTAFTFSFLLDLPILAQFQIKNWSIAFGSGLAFFLRGGVLEPGVKPDDINSFEVKAKDEISLINANFWKKARFIYPSLSFRFDYLFSSGWKVGLKLKSFIPIFNLWEINKTPFINSSIFQFSVVLHPAKK